ncbi:synaptotagmin-like protein 2 isoform X2 [Carcharodon carcharias]|uniref:synaptotagmin-like protein 2 isoform X2 n=1 Tax=Carcharodon carcharias TaxID=13397 RepID=UPI001B7DE3FB|nr:synaptotagmin-like protein 2 isoform X2 [Carcharodon carcharias]
MKTEKDLSKIMDLSFLSEDEQFALQKVVQRDAALRKLEENRIRKLKGTSFDATKLKVMTGEWFAEVKSKRFGDISSGIDMLKNSFNKKKKIPVVQDVAVKASNNANVFLSPSPRYQDISSEPEAFKSDKRLLEEAESKPQANATMSQSQLQATVNRYKPKDEARTWKVPSNDSSDFSVKTNKPSSLSTPSEVSVSTLPSNDPQNEEYDYFDDLTSESSFGSDILKQTDVYVGSNLQSCKLSGSLQSLYSDAGDFGDIPIQGAVQFKLHYEEAKKEFQIQVIQCRGLAVANIKKYTSDPYVKTYLLPDRSRPSKRKSSVKKATLNPQYNEILKYKIKKQELQNRTLNLSVWHSDTLGRNMFLGETEVEMSNWDWSDNTPNWYTLQSKPSKLPEENISQGEICVALKYTPAESIGGSTPLNGEVHIWLKRATQLQPLKPGGVDSFVRCYILPDTSKKSRQKTRVVKKTLNPIYNHTMVYDGFKLDEIMEACAELSIWDHETFTNQFLGGVRLNLGTGNSYGQSVDWMDSNEEEAALWKDMISKPCQWVEAVLPLRPTMTKRK